MDLEARAAQGPDRSGPIDALARRLRREIGAANVLTDRQELRTYECDGLAVHEVVPALVALPHRRRGDRPAAPRSRVGAHVARRLPAGCLMQIASAWRRTGGAIAFAHTAEVLDASIRGTPNRWAPAHQGG